MLYQTTAFILSFNNNVTILCALVAVVVAPVVYFACVRPLFNKRGLRVFLLVFAFVLCGNVFAAKSIFGRMPVEFELVTV